MTVYLQLILLTKPYATRPNNAAGHRRIIVDIVEGLPPAIRPEVPLQRAFATFWDLLEECWDKDPAMRPTVSDVLGLLKILVEQDL